MKITDTTGRSMLVDLVYKDPKFGWLQAPTFRLKGRSTTFAQVPHGAYALRICSMQGAEAILFEDGQKILQTTVPARTQFIESDANGMALSFTAPGEKKSTIATDQSVLASGNDTSDGANVDSHSDTNAEHEPTYLAPFAPAGHGSVFAVVRFPKQNSPYGEPPQEEFEVHFKLMEPDDHSEFFAQNFAQVEEAPALPNPRDEFSRVPADPAEQTHVHCAFSGCNHKH